MVRVFDPSLLVSMSSLGDQGQITSFLPFALILAIFYFMILRPNQRKQRETEAMLKAIKKGDRVLTSGGVFGTVVGNKNGRDDVVVLKVSDEVKMEFARQSIVQVLERGE